MLNRTIVIFGGSGFVGRHLANRLTRERYRLRIPTRDREAARALWVLPTTDVIGADVHDDANLDRLIRGSHAVVNLIGILNERGDNGAGFRTVHVDLTGRILAACRRQGVRRYLHMSALNAGELAPSHYLRSKGAAETLVQQIGQAGEIDFTIFRPSVIFGPDDSFFNRFAGLLRMAPVLPLACAQARFAPVYVGDVAEAFAAALESPGCFDRSYELCGPEQLTLLEIVRETARMNGLQRLVIPLGRALTRLQANILEYFPGKPLSRDNVRSASVDSVCQGGEGLADLGIAATPVGAVMPDWFGNRNERARLVELRRR